MCSSNQRKAPDACLTDASWINTCLIDTRAVTNMTVYFQNELTQFSALLRIALPSNLTNWEALLATCLAILSVSSAYLLYLLALSRKELSRLRSAIHYVLRGQTPPQRELRFWSEDGQSLWRSILTLQTFVRSRNQNQPAFDDMMQITSRLAGAADEVSSATREVVELLTSRLNRELVGIAVVLRDETDGGLILEQLSGLPDKRVSGPLMICFDYLLDPRSRDLSPSSSLAGSSCKHHLPDWGYNLSAKGGLFDFSTFGVGLTLTVPLRDVRGVCGGIWLGFKSGSRTLDPARREYAQVIANHAAASFYAAQKFRNRTEQTNLEKDFLLGISHDLRAPGNTALYAIRDILGGEDGLLNTEQHLKLSIVDRAIQEQQELLNDVLDLAKHKKGFLTPAKQVMSLGEIIVTVVESFRPETERKQLTLEYALPPPEFRVSIDPRHFQRIVANLLSNAIKYTDSGTISVGFRSIANQLEVLVTDTGIGIAEADRSKLFSEFTRFDQAAGRTGVGLGLALSKILADLNGARLFYLPNPQGGSIFGLGITLATEQQQLQCPLQLGNIVVLDDDPSVCRTNIRYLKDLAENVVPAQTCAQALELIRMLEADLLVTDLHLGSETVFSLFNSLSTAEQALPVVVVSGSSDSALTEALTRRPTTIVIEKPASREQLVAAVKVVTSVQFGKPAQVVNDNTAISQHSSLIAPWPSGC